MTCYWYFLSLRLEQFPEDKKFVTQVFPADICDVSKEQFSEWHCVADCFQTDRLVIDSNESVLDGKMQELLLGERHELRSLILRHNCPSKERAGTTVQAKQISFAKDAAWEVHKTLRTFTVLSLSLYIFLFPWCKFCCYVKNTIKEESELAAEGREFPL